MVREQSPVLVVGEERVGDPDLLREVPGQGEDLVVVAEGQALVLPVLVQVHGDGVVLRAATTVSLHGDRPPASAAKPRSGLVL